MPYRNFHTKGWLALVLWSLVSVHIFAQPVNIPDTVLEQIIRETLGKVDGILTTEEMEQLVDLDASVEKRGPNAPAIRNLKGLEAAINLRSLNLSGAFPLTLDIMRLPKSFWQCVCTDCAMGSEGPANLFDNQPTKWVSFVDSFGCAGFMMTPEYESTLIQIIRLRSANSSPENDPKVITIEGSNDVHTSPSNYDYLVIQATDLVNVPQLINRLHSRSDSLMSFLYGTLSQSTKDLIRLAIDKKESPPDLPDKLTRDLNQIMGRSSIYSPRRFRNVALRPETLELIEDLPKDHSVLRLNRLLLEDAFPDSLRRHRIPWQHIVTLDIPPFSDRFQWQEIEFQNNTAYRHYRLTVFETQDEAPEFSYTHLSELELLIKRGSDPNQDEVDLSPIARLEQLTTLNLSGNDLSHFNAPMSMSFLETLDLSRNYLTTISIPPDYLRLSQLKLNRNQLSLLELANGLNHLTELDVSYNDLTHLDLPHGLTRLKKLKLDKNQLTQLLLPDDLTNLQQLSATRNKLTQVRFPRNMILLGGVNQSWLRFGLNHLESLRLPPGLVELSDLLELEIENNPIQHLEVPVGMDLDQLWLIGARDLEYLFYIPLTIERNENFLELTWPEGELQSANNIVDQWTPVEGAASPYKVTTLNPQTFFRIVAE